MDTYLNKTLAGPGYVEILQALHLPENSPVQHVLQEIKRLKAAAAEGPQPSKKRGKKVEKVAVSKENPYTL